MTLREVFSSIANAIRSKTGKTATMKPVDMATEIGSIQTGGGNKLPQFIDGSLTTITAEDLAGATEVIDYAFYNNHIINSVILPNSVMRIGSYAFGNCSALTQITIPANITTFEDFVFRNCSKLMSINIPDNLESIKEYAFQNCSSLTSITIPANVTSIGIYALKIGSQTNKATITMKPTTPPTIDLKTFNADYLNKIIVPVGCGDAYKSATNWSNFANYIEEATA